MEIKPIFTTLFIITISISFMYPSLGLEDVDGEPLVNPGREMDAVEVISPASQEYNFYMLENLQPEYTTNLEKCMDKMGDGFKKCNEDVIKEILSKKPVSRECCVKIPNTRDIIRLQIFDNKKSTSKKTHVTLSKDFTIDPNKTHKHTNWTD
ncbi:unnamed protein product [Eruca vesicaria subsp. sativa]|uniref:Prolamin-like domain-containing protein n=1 Tax=Eruca vesicaria subsp. sativa TaxID=29727 RepID=A0ABC8JMD2_ERUVS|nr:unnamed protein product [Eruca vesicaria subsp. sativa]